MWGDTLEGDDIRVKAIKSDRDSDSDKQKRSPDFEEPGCPGVTNSSDATVTENIANVCNLCICLYVERFLNVKHNNASCKTVDFDALNLYDARNS